MAKTYIDIVKYMIVANFEIKGVVEKPDIIGAIFGQTEGLLGSGLDLRELQKNGKIGRIEIESENTNNRTQGKLYLPSSLSMVETAIFAAAIESVDRVGPFETKFKILNIEDTRSEKRKKIVERAKDLLKNLMVTKLPASNELSELVEEEVKTNAIISYGPDGIPAGTGIDEDDELIIVEGRADVINLLKCDINNCIAIGGASGSISKTIIDLSRKKDTTLFVDGDRGGEIIINNAINVAEIDYIARAPDGKEVEELTRKEIIKSLRSKMPLDQYLALQKNENYDPSHVKQKQEQYQKGNENSQQHQYQNNRQWKNERLAREDATERQGQEVLSPTQIVEKMKDNAAMHRITPQYSNIQSQPETSKQQPSKEDEGKEYAGSRSSSNDIPYMTEPSPEESSKKPEVTNTPAPEPKQDYIKSLEELKNTLRCRFYDESGKLIKEIPIREIISSLQEDSSIKTIVFDGVITQRLLDIARKQGVSAIYGIRSSQLSKQHDSILIYTKE
ncbi:MAG: DNA primase DnaG [Candidatus Micrarchaeia archaeon]